jgi:hypothetical protein
MIVSTDTLLISSSQRNPVVDIGIATLMRMNCKASLKAMRHSAVGSRYHAMSPEHR